MTLFLVNRHWKFKLFMYINKKNQLSAPGVEPMSCDPRSAWSVRKNTREHRATVPNIVAPFLAKSAFLNAQEIIFECFGIWSMVLCSLDLKPSKSKWTMINRSFFLCSFRQNAKIEQKTIFQTNYWTGKVGGGDLSRFSMTMNVHFLPIYIFWRRASSNIHHSL